MNANATTVFQLVPIGISLLALFISALSLGWNIYRDVILKARLRMRFNHSDLCGPAFPKPIETLILSATNLGPGTINCSMIQLKHAPLWRRLLRKTEHAVMIHDYENPLSGKLPNKLEVGEKLDLLIRWEKSCFLAERFTHIGLSDSFGRIHWAPKSDVDRARQEYKKLFHKIDVT